MIRLTGWKWNSFVFFSHWYHLWWVFFLFLLLHKDYKMACSIWNMLTQIEHVMMYSGIHAPHAQTHTHSLLIQFNLNLMNFNDMLRDLHELWNVISHCYFIYWTDLLVFYSDNRLKKRFLQPFLARSPTRCFPYPFS